MEVTLTGSKDKRVVAIPTAGCQVFYSDLLPHQVVDNVWKRSIIMLDVVLLTTLYGLSREVGEMGRY
jgi:hypothetical protein